MASISEIEQVIKEAREAANRRYLAKYPWKGNSKDVELGWKMFNDNVLGSPAMIKAFENLPVDWKHVGRLLSSVTNVKKFRRGIQILLYLASGDKKYMRASVRTAVLIFSGLYMGIANKADLKKFAMDQAVTGIDNSKQRKILGMAGGSISESTYKTQSAVTMSSGGLFEILDIGKAWASRSGTVSGLLDEEAALSKILKSHIEKASGVSLD